MTCPRRKRSRRPGTRTTAGTALRRSGASSQLKPPERSTVGRDSLSVCEWHALNGYCIASWVKWRDFVSRARRALRAGPSVTFYRSEARNISVIGIFQQLLAKCFQHGHRAQDNGGGHNNRPERKPTVTWEHAVGKQSCIRVQNIVTTTETQPFDSVPS